MTMLRNRGDGQPKTSLFWSLIFVSLASIPSRHAVVALAATYATQHAVLQRSASVTLHTCSTASFLQGPIAFWVASSSSPSANDAIVTRVQDDGTIQLRYVSDGHKESLRKLASIRLFTPSQFPSCLATTPTGKLQQLLPPKTRVRVERTAAAAAPVLTRTSDGVVVNERLVRLGYAKATTTSQSGPGSDYSSSVSTMQSLQQQARTEHKGVFQTCTDTFQASFDDYLAFDSRKPVVEKQPPNPGDRVGCSDFDYYEDALRYYDRYAPYYGDVARLDRNHDGVPCPGLPHTPNQVLYRLKRPTSAIRNSNDRSIPSPTQ